MNGQIRKLGIFLVLCYVALFVKLNQTQVLDEAKLNADPNNARPIQREYNRPRGLILSADGAVLAQSIRPTDEKDVVSPRVRVYPEGALFGGVTGYYSFLVGSSGAEKIYNDALTGRTFEQQVSGLADLFSNNENVGNVTLTVNKELQAFARDRLGDQEGSVVVLDPKTGAILALWSYPSFDPNVLSQGTSESINQSWALLNMPGIGDPLLNKTYQQRYPPGSTFKVVTAGTGLATGKVTNENPVYKEAASYLPPQTDKPIANFGGEICGGTLPAIMTTSCNSAFAEMGQATIGSNDMLAGAQSWGFNQDVPIDLTGAAQSSFPAEKAKSPAFLAQLSIGQNDNAATPLQMALVAGGAANHGTVMTPHVMRDIRNSEGQLVTTYEPQPWLMPMTPDKAEVLKQDMYGPVNDRSGTAFGLVRVPPGYRAGGKTGTAQTLVNNRVHTWFMGFVGPDGQDPELAISVVVLNQNGANNDATGGGVAGPIVSDVMAKALEIIHR